MTDIGEKPSAAEPKDPLQMFLYRGRIGPGFYFLGLLLEVGLLFLGLVVFAAAMSSTSGGGGPGLLLAVIPIVAWIHSLLVAKRLRDAGKPLGFIVTLAAAPFVVVGAVVTIMWNSGDTLETIGGGTWLVVVAALALFLIPGLLPRQAPP
jgi:uncharacterized membrane protein YhaH (DUF805 family)